MTISTAAQQKECEKKTKAKEYWKLKCFLISLPQDFNPTTLKKKKCGKNGVKWF